MLEMIQPENQEMNRMQAELPSQKPELQTAAAELTQQPEAAEDTKTIREHLRELGKAASETAENIRDKYEEKKAAEQAALQELNTKTLREYMRMSISANRKGHSSYADKYLEKAKELSKKVGYDLYGDQEFWDSYHEAGRKSVENFKENLERKASMYRPPTYGMPTTEAGWKDLAASELAKNGKSSYYDSLMKNAAQCHVEEELK